jgi:hypothetical protein
VGWCDVLMSRLFVGVALSSLAGIVACACNLDFQIFIVFVVGAIIVHLKDWKRQNVHYPETSGHAIAHLLCATYGQGRRIVNLID